jgi:hypothetical protein
LSLVWRVVFSYVAATALLLAVQCPAVAQEWQDHVRGSWVRDGKPQDGDVTLIAPGGKTCQIVVPDDANSAVKQAAVFLSGDLYKITGQAVHFAPAPAKGKINICLFTLGDKSELPPAIRQDRLKGQWEAYQILTDAPADNVYLVGSDARGTAFAAYTLSERLGVDPLYLWTGYQPQKHDTLVLKKTDDLVGPPTVKYRGFFHDDEDILPRPFEYSGYPLRIGDVPLDWYKKFFETALRLRMNMVAPYTRVHRRFEVQKTASDWGLFYTSHHYDILLSNPFGYHRFKLADQRGVTGDWNWLTNREGMLKYWRGGVEENGQLNCIWPVGLRGTDDYAYPFPKDMGEQQRNEIFQQVIQAQIAETEKLVPADKRPPVFHFTLYNEMLNKYLASGGNFEMPSDVILVWPDDNDGRMRSLPTDPGKWKHGVYYHLAYWGAVAKQAMHVVPPARVADQFKQIIDHRATEFMLVNVSELREFVMETRMIADICWDGKTLLADTPAAPMPAKPLPVVPSLKDPPPPDAPSPSADRYVDWWCREYFGDAAAKDAAEAYHLYYELINRWDMQWYASDQVSGAVDSLIKKFAGQGFAPAHPETVKTLNQREAKYRQAFAVIDRARQKMNRQQKQFFFDHLELPLRATGAHTEAAILLVKAMSEPDRAKAWSLCEQAMRPLQQMEADIQRAEHPPFDKWYRDSFIRNKHTGLNLHRPYYVLRGFLSSGGTQTLQAPAFSNPPKRDDFLPLLQEHF